jgi:hypothetical protein
MYKKILIEHNLLASRVLYLSLLVSQSETQISRKHQLIFSQLPPLQKLIPLDPESKTLIDWMERGESALLENSTVDGNMIERKRLFTTSTLLLIRSAFSCKRRVENLPR